MKHSLWLPVAVAALLALLAAPSHQAGETNPDNIPTANCFPWTNPGLDGARAAPLNHIVMFENTQVRVIEVTNAPSPKNRYHTHPRASLFMEDKSSSVRHYNAHGIITTVPALPPPVPVSDYNSPMTVDNGRVYFMAPNDMHSVENVDNKPFHAIRLEMKTLNTSFSQLPCPTVPCVDSTDMEFARRAAIERYDMPYKVVDPVPTAKCFPWNRPELDGPVAAYQTEKVVLENEVIRVLDVTINPGQTEANHTSPYPAVFIMDKNAGILITSATTGAVIHQSIPAVTDPVLYDAGSSFANGKILYFGVLGLHNIQNIDNKPFHAIRVELKQQNVELPC
ncbi:hypothetical protein CAOG_02824 [Capsaspora owczarzaki ATCC 30864]|uniref:Cupin type-1 domain-containing protein n=1 Tax=Capsaspora owczarzaki (strain ATCC 30864) TaxID=595528 RepID=A0A0D2X207_CAPO3|nr:hypothetical protein CAOG_02824 [Capsaspora owczarzaki ATCC 30864]KJE91729.1 hypothetical protein CAOG_002824 [Capsaspora owczarzaki ATCC 30864]|eukprot:XP_004348637.1 hypothetical protein CAOG_02824 [Capsaspora owczarzaki ATCC 30864]